MTVEDEAREWDRLRAFAGYKGRCECGRQGQLRQWPWEAEADEAAHRATCAILNLDLRPEATSDRG